MPRLRIAVVYDDLPRADTTGGYCLDVLSGLVDAVHLSPGQLDEAQSGAVDLYLCIDDGRPFPWPPSLHPSAYWAIDTHPGYAERLEVARGFDHVFCAQKAGAEQMTQDGVPAVWLPLA